MPVVNYKRKVEREVLVETDEDVLTNRVRHHVERGAMSVFLELDGWASRKWHLVATYVVRKEG